MDGTERIAVSRTKAMMAARALRTAAEKNRRAAPDLMEWGYETASGNCVELGRWYDEVADALEALDRTGASITPMPESLELAS